jgi:hypothetical protein
MSEQQPGELSADELASQRGEPLPERELLSIFSLPSDTPIPTDDPLYAFDPVPKLRF